MDNQCSIDEINRELQECDTVIGLTVQAACRQCLESARDNGWNVTHPGDFTDNRCVDKIAGKIALMHSELSEALEALRAGDEANGREEIADCLIRIFDFCGGLKWNMEAEVLRKLQANRSRGMRHCNDRGGVKRL